MQPRTLWPEYEADYHAAADQMLTMLFRSVTFKNRIISLLVIIMPHILIAVFRKSNEATSVLYSVN